MVFLKEKSNITIHGVGQRWLSCKCKPAKVFNIPWISRSWFCVCSGCRRTWH